MDSLNKNNLLKDLFYFSLILVFSVLIGLPLFKGQFISSCDYAGNLMRLLSMKQCFGHGQWMVRWVPQMYFGYGYPEFNFYPPLFYVLGVLLMNIGAGLIMAVNLSLFIAVFLSGCAMYLLAREFWGRQGAFVAGIAYLFAPYHIVDLYLRAAAAETFTFVFLPLILWSFYKLKQTGHKFYIASSALLLAGLLLTHNCISMIFLPIVPVYILFLYWPQAVYGRSFWQSFWSLGLGIGLAAIFWLPALVEKQFVHTELLTQGNEDFHHNFIGFKDLFWPPWFKSMPFFVENSTYCQIGLGHGLLVFIVLLGLRKILAQVPALKGQMLFYFMILLGTVLLKSNRKC